DPKPCKYGDGECIVKLCNTLFSERAAEEDPNLNLKALDPLKVDSMVLRQGGESPVSINISFTDNTLHGMRNLKVLKVKGFDKDLTATHELKLFSKAFAFVGPYTIVGKVLVLPISGTGQTNVKAIITIKGKALEKGGETYLDVTDLKLAMKPETGHFQFGNLFNGDKALGDNMNAFLNDNFEAIYKETSSAMERAFAEVFLGIVKNVFSHVPYAKLFEK
ncbi:hypothetical protein KR009_012174, partial [Drosophila setifemur]